MEARLGSFVTDLLGGYLPPNLFDGVRSRAAAAALTALLGRSVEQAHDLQPERARAQRLQQWVDSYVAFPAGTLDIGPRARNLQRIEAVAVLLLLRHVSIMENETRARAALPMLAACATPFLLARMQHHQHVTVEQLSTAASIRGFLGPNGPQTSHSDSTHSGGEEFEQALVDAAESVTWRNFELAISLLMLHDDDRDDELQHSHSIVSAQHQHDAEEQLRTSVHSASAQTATAAAAAAPTASITRASHSLFARPFPQLPPSHPLFALVSALESARAAIAQLPESEDWRAQLDDREWSALRDAVANGLRSLGVGVDVIISISRSPADAFEQLARRLRSELLQLRPA